MNDTQTLPPPTAIATPGFVAVPRSITADRATGNGRIPARACELLEQAAQHIDDALYDWETRTAALALVNAASALDDAMPSVESLLHDSAPDADVQPTLRTLRRARRDARELGKRGLLMVPPTRSELLEWIPAVESWMNASREIAARILLGSSIQTVVA